MTTFNGSGMAPLDFFSLLYSGVTASGYIEIRYLKGGAKHWMPWPCFPEHPDVFAPEKAPRGKDVYFGVALRKDSTDGKASNCKATHLVWCDIDLVDHPEFTDGLSKAALLEATPEELADMKVGLLAHLLNVCGDHGLDVRVAVDSGHGLQLYLARQYGTEAADTERYNKALAELLGGDQASTDIARILRVPHTHNLKNPKRPLPVQVLYSNSAATVTDEALRPLPLPEKTKPTHAPVSVPAVTLPSGCREEKYTRSAVDRELQLLSGAGEGGRNDQLNKSAFCIGQLVGAGWLAEAEAEALLSQTALSIGLPPSEARATVQSGLAAGKLKPRVLKDTEGKSKTGKFGTGEGKTPETPLKPVSGIYVEHGCYFIDRPVKKRGEVVDWNPECLTNWTWEPELRLVYSDGTSGERGALSIKGGRRHQIQLPSKTWNSRKDLLEAIGGYQAKCFTTNSADIAKIGDYITTTYPDLPEAKGVNSYGLHKHDGEWLEVFEDRTVSSCEMPPLFYSGTPVDPDSRSFKGPRDATENQIAEARRAIIKLGQLITPAVAYALLGYGAASAFSPRITPHLGNRLPFVYIAGERESGKTSGAQVVLELVTGYQARLTKAGGMTPYQYDIAHSGANNMLALLDEYRAGEIDDSQLRKHHDLGTKWRGAGMGSKDLAYELNAPLIVLGEGFSEDAATLSRGVLYLVRKADRGGIEAYGSLLKLPVWAYASHLHAQARATSDEVHLDRFRQAEKMADRAIAGSANPRLRYALTYIAYGLLFLQDDTGVIPDETILETLSQGASSTLDGGEEGVTNLELFLEQLCFSLSKVPNPDAYVTPSAIDNTLILRPRMCVDLVKERYKEQAAIGNAKLFTQYARQSNFFDDAETFKDMKGKIVRGRRLILSDIPARCDADFLSEIERRMRGKSEW